MFKFVTYTNEILNVPEQAVKRNWLRRAPLRSGLIPHLRAPGQVEQAPPPTPPVTELRLARIGVHCNINIGLW